MAVLAAARGTATARPQEPPGLLSPGAWFAFPGPFPTAEQHGGGEGGLILPSPPWSCVPDERSRGAAVGSPPPVLRNQRRRACFKFPPALTERPPLSRVGSGWVPIAPAWVYSCTEKRFVSYLYINHKKNQRYK